MKCEQAELHMAELLTGSLRAPEREELERHLLDCAPCRTAWDLARAGISAPWPAPAPSRRLVDQTRALFREPSGALLALRLGTAAAALLSVALVLATSGPPPRTPPAAPLQAGDSPSRRLAFVQEAVVGTIVGKDDQGRPVGELGLRSHHVQVEIQDGIAKTTVEENFQNHTDRRLEGTFQFPLPGDASISRLALEVNGKLEEGTCLERERAREVFESIVRRMKDPALLEWLPGGLFQCRIFPIEPHSTKRVVVAYTQALPVFRGRLTYLYPLVSEKTRAHPPGELRVELRARFSGPLTSIESPSHRFDVQRRDPHEARMVFEARNLRPEQDVVVTMETSDEELRVVPHREAGEEGYFALFVQPRGEPARKPGRYVFLLDVSASVKGPELEVAKRVVRGMMERRIEGDRFFILAHCIEVRSGGEVDLRGANDFMDRLMPLGGSDLRRALLAAPEGEIIYIGKGNATYGETQPEKILEAVRGRSVRTVAVGSRANLPLLERLGGLVRVSPNDNVPKRVEEIASTLGSPMLSGIQVDGGEGVYDLVGVRDIFYGERLVVLGRYRGESGKLVVQGQCYRKELPVRFPAQEPGNNYVRRLWAQRKIAELLGQGETRKQEVTELGIRHQIMTPYTSFLVLENEQMWKDHELKREVQKEDRVLGQSGKGKESPKRNSDNPKIQDPPGPRGEGESPEELRRLFDEATDLYRRGRYDQASSKFEEAFRMKPSSDQVYAYMKRAGEDLIAAMMNSPERKMQDTGRRIYGLALPGEHYREGKATMEKYLEDLRNESDFPLWRNAYWHLKNIGSEAAGKLIPSLGDRDHDRYRSRVMLLLTEMGPKASLAVAEALKSHDAFTRQNASIVLGNIKDERTLPLLAQRLEDPQELPDVKKVAEEALRKIDRRAAASPARPKDSPVPRPSPVASPKGSPKTPRITNPEAEPGIFFPESKVEPSLPSPEKTLDEVIALRRTAGELGRDQAELEREGEGWAPERGPLAGSPGFASRDSADRLVDRGALQSQQWQPNLEQRIQGWNQEYDSSILEGNRADSTKTVRDLPAMDFFSPTFKVKQMVPDPTNNVFFMEELDLIQPHDDGKSRSGQDRPAQEQGEATLRPSIPPTVVPPPREPEVKAYPLAQGGRSPVVAPTKTLEGKVTAVAERIGWVAITPGRDDGVLEGAEFVVYRGGEFVAKIVIDRADRKGSTGRVVLSKSVPRVADDVSNHIFIPAPQNQAMRPLHGSQWPNLKVVGVEGDQVTLGVGSDEGVRLNQLYAITRDQTFVAIVLTQEAAESRSWAVVWRGLSVGRILPGDQAGLVYDVRAYLASLPEESQLELRSRISSNNIRAKMRIR